MTDQEISGIELLSQDVKEFYDADADKALESLQRDGYQGLYMPELAEKRIETPFTSKVWGNFITTLSIRLTGKTIKRSPVVLYVHTKNCTSDQEYLRKSLRNFIKGAGTLPEDEFIRLLKLADRGDKNIILVPYYKLRNSFSGMMSIDDALDHPQTIPFFGSEDRAKKYLQRHKEVLGDEIGIFHCADLSDKPIWRWLYLGHNLISDNNFYEPVYFIGVRSKRPMHKI